MSAINILAGRLKLLPRDLATRSEGLSAQQIFKVSTDLLYKAFDEARRDFEAHVPGKVEQPSKNVVPFEIVSQAMRAHG